LAQRATACNWFLTPTASSGLLWSGTPGQLLDAAQAARIELASSTPLLAELRGVLARGKFAKQLAKRSLLAVDDLFDGYAALVTMAVPALIAPTIVRDPTDDQVLACAVAAQADLIVSGDAHLLDVSQFQGIAIVTAAVALQRIAQQQP
jgi:putative PIN family toxin of toxin-antitoxin system